MEAYTPTEKVEFSPAVTASVEKWTTKIKAARKHWEKDFQRMRANMEFTAGYQWREQASLDEKYVANMVVRQVNQKVAALYAKNPTFSAKRRRRLDFKIWDGRIESIQQAAALSMLPETPPEEQFAAASLMADYAQGRLQRDLVDKIGQTMQTLMMWYVDNQPISFKLQMKQMVRRVVTCGVGFVKVMFAREQEGNLSTVMPEASVGARLRKTQTLMDDLSTGLINENSAEMVELQATMSSLENYDMEQGMMNERLEFDFPPPTSIIVDPQCRALKGFIGARWVVQEHILPLAEVKAHFGIDIDFGACSEIVTYKSDGTDQVAGGAESVLADESERLVCVWEVYDLPTRSSFVLIDGYKSFVRPPAPVVPETRSFWPFEAITFNEVEVEPGKQKASIYPPSDVDIIKSAQRAWNKSRDDLKEHRVANLPRYATGKGMITDEDVQKLRMSSPHEVVQLESVTAETDITKIFVPFPVMPIDPVMYDTGPLMQDLFLANGNEEGAAPASSKATATAATINAQSRMVVTDSNVDDLDDLLSAIGEKCGEIFLRELSPETVTRIAGDGAIWVDIAQNREDFVQYVYLEVMAASSGKPNKALEISNFQILAPILQAAGVSPHFIAREALKRLDDRLDLDEAFALGQQTMMAMPLMQSPQQSASANPARGTPGMSMQNQLPAGTQPEPETGGVQKPQLTE